MGVWRVQPYFGLTIVKPIFFVKNSFAKCREKASLIVSFRDFLVKK